MRDPGSHDNGPLHGPTTKEGPNEKGNDTGPLLGPTTKVGPVEKERDTGHPHGPPTQKIKQTPLTPSRRFQLA